jgi:transcriptional regulator with XRE-family HTH domain
MNTIVRAWRRNRRASGNRLRALRQRAGLSQLALAAASGITNDTICRLELGRRSPQAGTIERLAKALDTDPQRFVSDEPEDDWSIADRVEAEAGAAAARR